MRNRRILAVVTTAMAAAAAAIFLIPAAIGASPKAKAATVECTATGTKPLTNSGVVAVSFKGKGTGSTGAPTSCSGKLSGKWAKNSTTFTLAGKAQGTVGKGGSYKLSGLKLDPLMGAKLAGKLTGSGGATGSTEFWSIDCTVSYSPLRIRCTIIISD